MTVRADDEIGILVDSFNRMTGDLAASQSKLEETYKDLQAKHGEVEDRRRYTETVLEAVATGVVSLDAEGQVTTINGAAERLLGLTAAQIQGRPVARVFRSPEYAEIDALIQRMGRGREGSLDREVHLRRGGQAVALLASATALRGPDGAYLGMVLAFDDLTELLKAQRLAAWREVAQRIAHEIKNPLTPIQLSAQRLRRRLTNDRNPDEKRLLEEATATIIQEVEGLRQLVDEFSRFARMPALTPKPTDLARLLEGVVVLYRESHPSLAIRSAFSPDLPAIEVDPDQIKRAVLNLVDNAVEAVGGTGEVCVQTAWLPESHRVRIVVTDDGPGISAEDRERLFMPYFSTKATGMGLGLPIVHQIVSDHGGTIRVEDNAPHGSRFVIELPAGRPVAAPVAGLSRPMAGEHILIVDDERAIQTTLTRRARGRRLSGHRGGLGRAGPRPPAGRHARHHLPRHLDAGHRRARHPRRDEAPAAGARGGDDLRPRHHRDRGQGHQARRLRLHREAALAREDAADRDPGPRAHAARAREPQPARPARARPGDRRQEPADRAPAPADRGRGALERPRAHPGRERHRQGAGGPRRPHPVRAARGALRRGQLRGHPRGADRVRAVRSRARRLHRRGGAAARASSSSPTRARSSSTRSAT